MNGPGTTRRNPAPAGLLPANAAALAERHPLALRRILAGLPASPRPAVVEDAGAPFLLRMDGRLLHDATDPEREARSLVAGCGAEAASALIVFGFGAGYVPEAVRRAATPDACIYLVVLDPGAFLVTLAARDVTKIFLDPRVHIILGGLRDVAPLMPSPEEAMAVVVHEPLLAASAPALRPIADMGRELAATQASRREQIGPVLDNLCDNLDAILDAADARDLAPALAGRPVLLVAPGPSLDSQLPILRTRPLPLLVALDTSLRPLAAAGIAPDLAVTLDPTPANVAKFEGIDLRCPLVFFGGARPEAVRRAKGRIFACEESGILDGAHPWFGRGGRFRPNGSVLLAAMDILLGIGASPIALVGADLAHTNGRAHAAGAGRRSGPAGARSVSRRGGGTIESSETLWRHARRLSRRLAGLPAGRVLDARADGADVPGMDPVDLAAWLDGLSPADRPVRGTALIPTPRPPASRAEIRRAALAAIRRVRG